MTVPQQSPLIAHVVFRFDIGGMENGVVTLLNRMPRSFARHCVISLTEINPEFTRRVQREDVSFHALHKPAGQTLRVLPRFYRLLRQIRPSIVHTRNIAPLETQVAAFAAGVPVRIHGEHGWDTNDLGGSNARLLALRRVMKHFVHHQIALSSATMTYLTDRVGVDPARASHIFNGVNPDRFSPLTSKPGAQVSAMPFARETQAPVFVVGTVGRLSPVKHQAMLVQAFALARQRDETFARNARLAIIGDGPDGPALKTLIDRLGLADQCWMPGARDDIPALIPGFDVFCLPSLAEGISNAILESMACGVPVIATDVGGNAELVTQGVTGFLVPSADAEAMATRLLDYFNDRSLLAAHKAAARADVVERFSVEAMVGQYQHIYAQQLRRAGIPGVIEEPMLAPSARQ